MRPIPVAPPPAPGEPYARDELLHEIFMATAARLPGQCALRLAETDPEISRRESLTYAELAARATQVARFLLGRGVGRGDRVVICLPRGLDQFSAILGTLLAGAAYVPVDWGFPADRIDFIARDAGATLLFTTFERRSEFASLGDVLTVVPFDDRLGDFASQSVDPLTRLTTGCTPDDLAYIIYTSGTTGRPKGVAIRHRNACHLVRSESAILSISDHDAVWQGFSLAFDMSVEEMWQAWFVGATLVVSSEALAKSGPDVAEAVATTGVTVWNCVPSLLAVVETPLPAVRLINLGGEACPAELARRWTAPGRRLLNTYGPTETTVTATWAELAADRPVTIGTPLPGYRAWVVDEALRPVADGLQGELVIGGPGVGAGYLNRPELTAEKFVTLTLDESAGPELVYRTGDLVAVTPDGEIAFAGRIDTQVKIRGYRVELGEIESAIADDPAVAQVACGLHGEAGSEVLVAWLMGRSGATLDVPRIAESLKARMPAYMRPGIYEVVDSLPTLVSGKVDRKALPAPKGELIEVDPEPPATPMEATLHAIWADIFAPRPVSVTADFFEDLGGHSLRAARAVSAARKRPELARLSINDLYAAPTIRALAARLDAAAGAGPTAARAATTFQPVPVLRYVVCAVAQTLALPFVFAFAGLQWLLPYLAYVYLASQGSGRLVAALAGAATFILTPPMMLAVSIAAKWLIIGRYRAGDYPLWGLYYFRWWLVRRILGVVPVHYLAGSPFFGVYHRLLGARVGRDATLSCDVIDAADLADIGDGASLGEGTMLATSAVEAGRLRLGPVTIGRDATVEAMAVVGRDARVDDGARLDELSAVSAGGVIPAGEHWSGSPAEHVGPHRPPSREMPSPARRLAITAGLFAALGLLPLVAVLPLAPGLVLLIETDWATEGYAFLAFSPLLAAAYVGLMCFLLAALKWTLLGRVTAGTRSIWSGFYVRFWFIRQLGVLALDLLHPIFATLFVAPWFRLMGARVGRRAEISTAASVVHDLVDIGPESFIADGVVLGAARIEGGRLSLLPTVMGRRSFIGNSGVLPAGSRIGNDALIGVLSKPPLGREQADDGATWFGSPPIRLPVRQVVTMFNEGARFNPSRRLVAARLAMESVRVILSLTLFIAFLSALLSVVGDLADRPDAERSILIWYTPLYLGFVSACGLSVVALKWLLIGRYKVVTKPLWSFFVWRTEMVTSTYENLAVNLLLEPLRGTPWLPFYLRLMGARIGRRVFMDTTDLTEHDLVDIGDDAALNDAAGLQTHLFEDRVMKVGPVTIGARATVGSLAIVLYDSEVGESAELGDLSVLMKGETLAAGTAWEGSPARPASE